MADDELAFGTEVTISTASPPEFRPGSRAWVVALPTAQCDLVTIEFEDGSSAAMPRDALVVPRAPRYACPVCGFDELAEAPWDGDSSSLEICPSCGMQFGYDDAAGGSEAARRPIHDAWRLRWITDGTPWRSVRPVPPGWDPVKQLRRMGGPPVSRREALLRELCMDLGFCDTGLTPDDLTDGVAATEIVELVLSGEGLDPTATPGTLRQAMRQLIDDWLFDPNGRGARSGLPR